MNPLKTLLLSFLLSIINIMQADIQYTISFPNPENHYCKVDVSFIAQKDKPAVGMPVWAPGSYLVREYSKSMEAIESNKSIKKIRKNQWQLDAAKGEEVTFSYLIYGNEVSVRTNMIYEDHAFLSPTATLVYVQGQEEAKHKVDIKPHANWSNVACGLQNNADDLFWEATNYDILVDAPIEVGNHDEFTFTAKGVKHRVAMVGKNNADYKQLAKDMKKIVETTIDVWGTLPIKKYLFIVEHVASGGGGLEHLNSTVLMMSRNNYTKKDKYVNFLSLVAHEYFHLWNVKRLRPLELGPFDYDNENYTELLWFFEGFTAYYDELLLLRAGYINKEEYLQRMATNIERTENRPGVKVQSLASASYDAWIKAYRRNENSSNTTISYYGKGSLVALLLDIEICATSNGKKNLDELMQSLYKLYQKNPEQGIREKDIIAAAEKITGKKLNAFFKEYVHQTKPLDYKSYLAKVGIDYLAEVNNSKVELGTSSKLVDGKLIVQSVKRGSAAYVSGIIMGDELVSINNERITDLSSDLKQYEVGDTISIVIYRDKLPLTKQVVLGFDNDLQIKLVEIKKDLTSKQTKANAKWLIH